MSTSAGRTSSSRKSIDQVACDDPTYDEIASSSPPSPPLSFPPPTFRRARRTLTPVRVPGEENGDSSATTSLQIGPSALRRTDSTAGNVLVPQNSDDSPSTVAYWIQRKLHKTEFGSLRAGFVLRPRSDTMGDDDEEVDDEDRKRMKLDDEGTAGPKAAVVADLGCTRGKSFSSVVWEVIPKEGSGRVYGDDAYQMIAIKLYERSKVLALRGRRMEDPMVEMSVLQLISNQDPEANHVLGSLDVLEDERYFYVILPFCSDGDLFEYVSCFGYLEEGIARHFFRQILKGLDLFQRVGVCHRGLSLEHILLRGTNCYIVGNSMCLRVPYSPVDDSSSSKGVTDGTVRRLITPQGQCGRHHFIAPEILSNDVSFDGFAVDLWAAGIMLFVMLFGQRPFVWAASDDPNFHLIAVKNKLHEFVQKWCEGGEKRRGISDEAVDLLQSMMLADPRDRLTLRQVMDHTWVRMGEEIIPPMPPTTLKMDGGAVAREF